MALLVAIAGYLGVQAYGRYLNPPPIQGGPAIAARTSICPAAPFRQSRRSGSILVRVRICAHTGFIDPQDARTVGPRLRGTGILPVVPAGTSPAVVPSASAAADGRRLCGPACEKGFPRPRKATSVYNGT